MEKFVAKDFQILICLLHFDVASDLTFDDSEKKQKYETISFKEIHDELVELKVSP